MYYIIQYMNEKFKRKNWENIINYSTETKIIFGINCISTTMLTRSSADADKPVRCV